MAGACAELGWVLGSFGSLHDRGALRDFCELVIKPPLDRPVEATADVPDPRRTADSDVSEKYWVCVAGLVCGVMRKHFFVPASSPLVKSKNSGMF